MLHLTLQKMLIHLRMMKAVFLYFVCSNPYEFFFVIAKEKVFSSMS